MGERVKSTVYKRIVFRISLSLSGMWLARHGVFFTGANHDYA